MALSTGMVFADVPNTRYVAEVGTKVAPKTGMLLGGVPIVTLTGSGDYDGNKITMTANGKTTVLAGGRGGVGLADDQATVTPTGAYAFPVTGATEVTVTPGATPVYITSGGDLTISASGNTRYGVALFFRGEDSATDTVVQIGV